MDYGNFYATVGQEEGIKRNIKFPKYSIGEKFLYATKRNALKAMFKCCTRIYKAYLKGWDVTFAIFFPSY